MDIGESIQGLAHADTHAWREFGSMIPLYPDLKPAVIPSAPTLDPALPFNENVKRVVQTFVTATHRRWQRTCSNRTLLQSERTTQLGTIFLLAKSEAPAKWVSFALDRWTYIGQGKMPNPNWTFSLKTITKFREWYEQEEAHLCLPRLVVTPAMRDVTQRHRRMVRELLLHPPQTEEALRNTIRATLRPSWEMDVAFAQTTAYAEQQRIDAKLARGEHLW